MFFVFFQSVAGQQVFNPGQMMTVTFTVAPNTMLVAVLPNALQMPSGIGFPTTTLITASMPTSTNAMSTSTNAMPTSTNVISTSTNMAGQIPNQLVSTVSIPLPDNLVPGDFLPSLNNNTQKAEIVMAPTSTVDNNNQKIMTSATQQKPAELAPTLVSGTLYMPYYMTDKLIANSGRFLTVGITWILACLL